MQWDQVFAVAEEVRGPGASGLKTPEGIELETAGLKPRPSVLLQDVAPERGPGD
jgi:hypothetical protein